MKNSKKRVLVTGASGFIGRALVHSLLKTSRHSVTCMLRSDGCRQLFPSIGNLRVEMYTQDQILSVSYWEKRLQKIDYVVHLAGRAHVLKEKAFNPSEEYMRVNTHFTEALVQASARAGLEKLVFVSTVGVHGRFSRTIPVSEESDIVLDTDYAKSKWKAEEAIRKTCSEHGISYVILRPPLVYGRYVRGNFLRLLKWISSGLPIVVCTRNNKRSLVYVGNLVDVILRSLEAVSVNNQEFVVSDGYDISFYDLATMIAKRMCKRCITVSLPVSLWRLAGVIANRRHEVDSIIGNYVLDSSKLQAALKWSPEYSLRTGIEDSVDWFVHSKENKFENG